MIKIPTEEILHDFAINNTDNVIVGNDRQEVLDWLQERFAREFRRYGMLNESERRLHNQDVKQAWTRIRRIIKKSPN